MEWFDQKRKLLATLRELDIVMMTTNSESGTLHARPMAIAEVDDDGSVWFVTRKDEKVDEVRTDRRALVTGQTEDAYLSLSGRVDLIHDPERVRALWRPSWNTWLPEGKHDPDVLLMRLRAEVGEYWDRKATRTIRYAFDAGRARGDGTAQPSPKVSP
jgi:general stress protein 26